MNIDPDSEHCQDWLVTRAYHHGDLAAALAAEALAEVRVNGANDVSLRTIAHTVGVSPSAAYHHFPDKAALLSQVAAAGQELLDEALRQAVATVPAQDPASAVARLAAVGRAYVGYASAEPHLFRLMFSPYCAKDERGREGSAAFQILTTTLDALDQLKLLRPGIRPGLELLAWTAVHGASELLLQGQLTQEEVEALLLVTLNTFLVEVPLSFTVAQ